jgi:hypothetical protein
VVHRWRGRLRAEDGVVGGIEIVAFGLLVFVAGVLLVANAWAVVDATMAASGAAREGARAAVESTAADVGGAAADARAAAGDALAGHGRDPGRMTFELSGDFRRCGRITVRVAYDVPWAALPWIGGGGVMTASARHSELVDPYRDDVPFAEGGDELGVSCDG